MQRITAIFLVSTVLLAGLGPVAQAWIAPSFFAIKSMAKKHESLNSGRFRSRISVFKGEGELVKALTEVLTLTSADQATSKLLDDTGAEIASHSRRLLGGRNNDRGRPVLYDLVFIKDRASIFDHFKALGLPLKTEDELYSEREGSLPFKPEPSMSLARYESRIAVVIADKEKPGTQLWLEKDSYLPLRAIVPPDPDRRDEQLDIRLSGQLQLKGFLYPRLVTVYRGDQLWLKIELLDGKVNEPLTAEPARAKAQLPGELSDFSEQYFKWIR